MADPPASADVVIVGAGPAGLAAAAELRRRGVGSVLVLDRAREAGGVPRRCGHSPFGFREFGRPMFGRAYAAALVGRAEAAGVEIRTAATVTALAEGPRLSVTSDAGVAEIDARAVLVATGVRETPRAARLIGGSKPGGVLVSGALQDLVYGAGLRPFRNPVILGSELVAFSALLTCRHAGIRPVALVEPGTRTTARFPAALLPRALGVPLLFGREVIAIEGSARVEAVVLSGPSGPETLAADGVVVTGRFTPESGLLRTSGFDIDPATGGPVVDEGGRCSVTGYYAAGNVLRPVETAGWCWAEARAVAGTIARDLGGARAAAPGALKLVGDALRYAVPQRIAGDQDPALARFQLRLSRPARGCLSLTLDGEEIHRLRIDGRPERRLSLPLPRTRGDIALRLEENV